jgi:hypothetical protein
MLQVIKKSIIATVVIGWTLAAQWATAGECLSPSPTVQNNGDPFGPIEVRELAPDEHKNLVTLFNSLAGQWQGRSDTFFCRSRNNPDDVELGQETIRKARVDVDRNGNLQMDAEFYDEKRRAKSLKRMWLYLNNKLLRYNNDNGTGDVQLLSVSDTQVAFLFRNVLSHRSGGSSRQEYFITLTKVSTGFRIEENLYVQGKLSSGYTWQFER